MKKKPILVPLGVALAAMFPPGAQAKVGDAGQSTGHAQAAVAQALPGAPDAQPLLALPNGDAMPGYARHHSHHSHYSHRSHYSSSGGGHYSHSSHSSHYSSY